VITLHEILDSLLKTLAPILCFTVSEAWEILHPETSIYQTTFTDLTDKSSIDISKWNSLWQLRRDIHASMEPLRAGKLIGTSLDTKISLEDSPLTRMILGEFDDHLKDYFVCSEVVINLKNEPQYPTSSVGIKYSVEPTKLPKCPRCWKHESLHVRIDHPELCSRCYKVVLT